MILFNLTIGNSLVMPPLLLAETSGARHDGRIYATSQLLTLAGVAGCPALRAMIYELSGGYAAPFLGVAGLTLVGFAVLARRGTARR